MHPLGWMFKYFIGSIVGAATVVQAVKIARFELGLEKNSLGKLRKKIKKKTFRYWIGKEFNFDLTPDRLLLGLIGLNLYSIEFYSVDLTKTTDNLQ